MTNILWRSRLVNSARFIDNIVYELNNDRSVMLLFGSEIPWEDIMIDTIIQKLECKSGRTSEIHDVSDADSAGEYLLKHFCSKDEQAKFWPTTHESPEKYLSISTKTTIHKRYVFLTGIKQENALMWTHSVTEYLKNCDDTHEHGVFITIIKGVDVPDIKYLTSFRYNDYVTDYDNINSQVIQFGENLLDMIREVRGEDLCTVVVPLGAKDEETEERLTIASVNDGKDYIEDAEAIALYGRIVKVIEYDDVTLPENLMRKGQSVLNSQRLLSVCITLTAVDLHLLNVDIEKIKLGDLIRVISKPHGLDEYLMIQKLELDISHPENSKVTLGITKQTLAESVGKKERQAITEILNVQSSQSERLSSVRTEIRECYSEISKTSEEIRSEVREEYLSKDDLETIRQDFETSITQSSTEIRMDFTTVTNDILSQVNGNQRLLEEYIRFKGALIELGKVGNAFTCELDNTRLAFKQNGVVIAYFSNNSLMITDAEVRNRLSFGTADNGYFDFIPRANGNLSVRYRNGAS